MKGTKEDVTKYLNDVADGMKSIAGKILNEQYNPEDWKEISRKFQLVYMCLQVQGEEFMSKNNNPEI